MDILEAVRLRKSIRGYKSDIVPVDTVREILEVARRAPSATNSQPWYITVLTGKVLEDVKQTYIEMLNSRVKPDPDIPIVPYPGVYRERQVDLAIDIFKLMGVAREDKKARWEWQQRGFRFFDAPVALILSVDKVFEEQPLILFDLGAITQTICLVALSYGLGTCIHRQGVMYPGVLRRLAGIPESRRIIASISMGYPDPDFPANALETPREPLEGFVSWCGWE